MTHPAVKAYHQVLVWDIVKAPMVTRTADRVLSPLIGKSLVVYLTKPDAKVSGLSDSRPNVPRGVPGRRGDPTRRTREQLHDDRGHSLGTDHGSGGVRNPDEWRRAGDGARHRARCSATTA